MKPLTSILTTSAVTAAALILSGLGPTPPVTAAPASIGSMAASATIGTDADCSPGGESERDVDLRANGTKQSVKRTIKRTLTATSDPTDTVKAQASGRIATRVTKKAGSLAKAEVKVATSASWKASKKAATQCADAAAEVNVLAAFRAKITKKSVLKPRVVSDASGQGFCLFSITGDTVRWYQYTLVGALARGAQGASRVTVPAGEYQFAVQCEVEANSGTKGSSAAESVMVVTASPVKKK